MRLAQLALQLLGKGCEPCCMGPVGLRGLCTPSGRLMLKDLLANRPLLLGQLLLLLLQQGLHRAGSGHRLGSSWLRRAVLLWCSPRSAEQGGQAHGGRLAVGALCWGALLP